MCWVHERVDNMDDYNSMNVDTYFSVEGNNSNKWPIIMVIESWNMLACNI